MTEPKRRVKHTTAKQQQDEATAAVADFLDISDIAAYMRGEIKPPAMLVPEWLQKGVLHWMQGEPEDGKSWIVLHCAVKLLEEDEDARVLIMDGEMGARAVGERLHALGLDPKTAFARVTHVNLSAVEKAHWQEFVIWAKCMCFTLIIWDPIVHHLAGAGLSENSNSEFQQWVSGVVSPLLSCDVTVVGVDHLRKDGGDSGGYARGAGGKKASARVVYELRKEKGSNGFDRTTVGSVIVTLEKNSEAASIPKQRQISLGGDPETGRFVMRSVELDPTPASDGRRDTTRRIVDDAVKLLEKEGRELPGTVIAKRVQGKEKTVKDAIRENALSGGGRLHQRAEELPNQTRLYYSLRTDDSVRIGPS